MSQFVFLYRGGDAGRSEAAPSPEQMQAVMQKWISWMKQLREAGQLRDSGSPLEPTGKVVSGPQKTVTDGPYPESKDLIGGYSIIEATDLAHAAEIAKGCPAFEYGGFVEVRPVMEINV
jgi:hypothetical protein